MKSWLYKEGEEPRIFKGEDVIEDALENGWVDSPKDFKKSEAEPVEGLEVVAQAIETFSDDELIAEAEARGLKEEKLSLTEELDGYDDDMIITMLGEIKDQCIKREIKIAKVIPHDTEGDVDLNDLSDDKLKTLLDERGENYPHNIGREKLLERLSPKQD